MLQSRGGTGHLFVWRGGTFWPEVQQIQRLPWERARWAGGEKKGLNGKKWEEDIKCKGEEGGRKKLLRWLLQQPEINKWSELSGAESVGASESALKQGWNWTGVAQEWENRKTREWGELRTNEKLSICWLRKHSQGLSECPLVVKSQQSTHPLGKVGGVTVPSPISCCGESVGALWQYAWCVIYIEGSDAHRRDI